MITEVVPVVLDRCTGARRLMNQAKVCYIFRVLMVCRILLVLVCVELYDFIFLFSEAVDHMHSLEGADQNLYSLSQFPMLSGFNRSHKSSFRHGDQ